MKKQLMIIALLLLSLQGLAQFSLYSRYFPYNQKTDVYPVTSNPDGGLPIIFISGNDVKISYFNDECKFKKEILIKRSIKNTRLYLGSYIDDSSLVITFSNKKLKIISQLIVSLKTGEYTELPVSEVDNTSKYLASWEVKDSLYVVSIRENSSVLTIRKFFGMGNSSVNDFDLNTILPEIELSDKFSTLFDLFDTHVEKLQKIDTSIPVSLQMSSANNKIYLLGNELLITFDNKTEATKLLSLNILDYSCNMVSYRYRASEIDQLPVIGNSFIYDNTLFQVVINSDELVMKIRGIADCDRKANYVFFKGDTINFSNSGMYERNEKEGFMFGDPVIRGIRSTRKFLKLVSKMQPAISVFDKTSNYQILIGGVIGIHQATGIMASTKLSSGGEMIVGASGNLAIPDPVFNIPTNYSFSSYSSCLTDYFSSVVDAKTLIHNSKSISKYTYDYIIEYANYMPGRYGLVAIFKMKGDYYLGYYSYSDKTYNIEWFKNIDNFSINYRY